MEAIKEIFDIHDQLRDSKVEYECEARIQGYFVNKESCTKFINNNTKNMDIAEYTELNKMVNGCRYRCRNGVEVICKSSLFRRECTDLWFSLHISSEVPIRHNMQEKFANTKERKVIRASGVVNGCKIEIGSDDSIPPLWWVEVERIAGLTKLESFYDTIEFVIKSLQGSKELLRFSDYEILRQIPIDYITPITLTKKNFKKFARSCKWVSPKYDGVRMFLVIRMGRVFKIDLKGNIFYQGVISKKDDRLTILDCEEVDGVLYIMDIICDLDITKRLERREMYKDYFQLKPFYKFQSVDQIEQILNNHEIPIDGVILATTKQIYKWKPNNTVDLLVKEDGLYTTTKKVCDDTFEDLIGRIYEFSVRDRYYIPYRPRIDRLLPNSYKVFLANTSDNKISREVFQGRGAYFMRKYHNEVKMSLLSIPRNRKGLLDIGSGQSGDYSKWKRLNYSYICSVDPDPDMLGESQRRKTIADYYITSTLGNLQRVPLKVCDIITAFFCMNLFREKDFIRLFSVIKEKKPTYFMGICMTTVQPQDNPCFTTTTLDNKKYKITIHGTFVNNNEERLVDMKWLQKKMESLGYKLVKSEKLTNKLAKLSSNERLLSSFYKLFVYKLNKANTRRRFIVTQIR